MAVIEVADSAATSATPAEIPVDTDSAVVNTPPNRRAEDIPFSVSRRQICDWTTRWQEDERASLDEIARGEAHRFTNAGEAIRWLLDPEDD
jgi:hypothetical protein